jgi:hypothetical protein
LSSSRNIDGRFSQVAFGTDIKFCVLTFSLLSFLKVEQNARLTGSPYFCTSVCVLGGGNSMFVYSSSYNLYQPYAKGGHSQRSIFRFHGNNNVAEARTCETGPTIASTTLAL